MPNSDKRQVPCPHCGAIVFGEWDCEEALVSVETSDLHAPGRNFRGECSTHGDFIHQDLQGHHSTETAKALKNTFTKAQVMLLKSRLGSDAKKRLQMALDGFCIPSESEIAEWKRVLAEPE